MVEKEENRNSETLARFNRFSLKRGYSQKERSFDKAMTGRGHSIKGAHTQKRNSLGRELPRRGTHSKGVLVVTRKEGAHTEINPLEGGTH